MNTKHLTTDNETISELMTSLVDALKYLETLNFTFTFKRTSDAQTELLEEIAKIRAAINTADIRQ